MGEECQYICRMWNWQQPCDQEHCTQITLMILMPMQTKTQPKCIKLSWPLASVALKAKHYICIQDNYNSYAKLLCLPFKHSQLLPKYKHKISWCLHLIFKTQHEQFLHRFLHWYFIYPETFLWLNFCNALSRDAMVAGNAQVHKEGSK